MYSKTLFAGWGDMDFNAHMKNTAFLDKSADVRKLVAPPRALLAVLQSLPQTSDFAVLPSSVKARV